MKQKQRIALFDIIAVALILAACDNDSGNNSSESEEDSSSSIEFSSSSEQINSSSVVKSSSSSVVVSSSSLAVSSSSAKLQSSSSVLLSSSVVKSSSSSVVVSSSSVKLPSSSSVSLSSSVDKSSSSSVVVLSSSSSVKSQSSSSVPLSSSTIESSSSSSVDDGSLTYGGQTYKTVTIGTQTWMAENLNFAVDRSWCYNNSADSCAKYGRLYQWTSAMDIDSSYITATWGGSDVNHQGICPEGWHLPGNDEWHTLYDYVDANNADEGVGTNLKSTSGWEASSDIETGTDRFGFSALPAGYRLYGYFIDAGNFTYFWSATESNSGSARSWGLVYSGGGFSGSSTKGTGFSVRCLKDSE